MKQPFFALLTLVTVAISPGHAQWASEVTSFRTVEIGANAASIPECPKRKHKFLSHEEYVPDYDTAYPSEAKDKLCWKSTDDRPLVPGAKAITLSNLPFIKGAGREVTATVIDGTIESIDSRFLAQYAQTFQQALTEKYGPPTRSEQRSFQNRLGAKFNGISLAWYGQRVTLTFDEVDGSSEWGMMSMRSRKFDAALKAAASGATDSVKRGL
jgi:hypothetical protein